MSANSICVVALGASTPIGRDAWSSAAAARGSVTGFTDHPYAIDTAGNRFRVAMAPWLAIDCDGQDRLEALLFPALEQALEPAVHDPNARIALALGLPASRPGLPPQLEQRLRAAVLARFKDRFVAVATFPVGHAGSLVGLAAALKRISDGSFDGCVVAGVESYLTVETLEWLEENEQLHGAGPLNNAWGFIPGEGAGAVLLVSGDTASRWDTEPLGSILGVGSAFEQNRIKTPTVCIGEGLTAAFREALAGLPPGETVTDTYCDMNGEPYRADEYGFACLRTKEAFRSASSFIASADCWGDVAAASVPLAIVQATIAAKKAYANGNYAFLWASSEGGERGAALLELPAFEPR
jgi:3-oxoacyl-[acyl-carrier-protein] synthase-1